MNNKKLLLLSNSTNFGESYLHWPIDFIKDFLDGVADNILFIPYAGVTIGWTEYFENVAASMGRVGLNVSSITSGDPKLLVDQASAIVVGGGNSFYLLDNLQKLP